MFIFLSYHTIRNKMHLCEKETLEKKRNVLMPLRRSVTSVCGYFFQKTSKNICKKTASSLTSKTCTKFDLNSIRSDEYFSLILLKYYVRRKISGRRYKNKKLSMIKLIFYDLMQLSKCKCIFPLFTLTRSFFPPFFICTS